jgi:hypothetical protein
MALRYRALQKTIQECRATLDAVAPLRWDDVVALSSSEWVEQCRDKAVAAGYPDPLALRREFGESPLAAVLFLSKEICPHHCAAFEFYTAVTLEPMQLCPQPPPEQLGHGLQTKLFLARQSLRRHQWDKSWDDIRMMASYSNEVFDDEINWASAHGHSAPKSLAELEPDHLATHGGFTAHAAVAFYIFIQ